MTTTSVPISIRNLFTSQALVQLYHQNASGLDTHGGGWIIPAHGTAFAFNVQINPTYGNNWRVKVTTWGPGGAVYENHGTGMNGFTFGMLTGGDAAGVTFSVSANQFSLPLAGGPISINMTNIGPYHPITNVFVLMLENHSCDNIFAGSGIAGLTKATTSNSTSYNGISYPVVPVAPYSLTTDPGHEFLDVVQQLTGRLPSAWTDGQTYPPINMSGFAANYATSSTEDTGVPGSAHYGDTMRCFNTPSQLPVILKLAQEFAVCDHWFSSMPGPTWPNRYFAHAASSANMDDSPPGYDSGFMQYLDGLSFDNGTIFDKLDDSNMPYRLYNDASNRFADTDPGQSTFYGSFAQVSSIEGISTTDVVDLINLPSDLQLPYLYRYTFIEPNYGDVDDDTFANGSSQHPMDGMGGGEALIKFVYETIRNSPVWYTSLLIVTYDEHGGFYDSVAPPAAHPPGDSYFFDWYNTHGFQFNVYGPRVPALVISPLIKSGIVNHFVFDHSSIPRTVENFFGLGHLTNRDTNAIGMDALLSLSFSASNVRTDCPQTLPTPVRGATPQPRTSEEKERTRSKPLPQQGNVWGFLHVAAKTEFELLGKTEEARAAVLARVNNLRTYGDAQDYKKHVLAMLAEWRSRRAASQ